MTSWAQVERTAPEFAARVHRAFAMGIHKTMATLRADGSPRISATELYFSAGDVRLGMMGGSVKLRDVRRDPRVAFHSPTLDPPDDPSDWPGDAKLAGTLVEIDATPQQERDHPGAGFFRLDIHEVVLTYVGELADHLVIESWHPDRDWQRRQH